MYPPSFHALLAQLSAHHKAETAQEGAHQKTDGGASDDAHVAASHKGPSDSDRQDVPSKRSEHHASTESLVRQMNERDVDGEEEEEKDGVAEEVKEAEEVSVQGHESPGRGGGSFPGLDPKASEAASPRPPLDVKSLATLRALDQYRTLDLRALEEYRRALELRTLEARAAQYGPHMHQDAPSHQLSGRSTPSPGPSPSAHTPPESPACNEETLYGKRPEYNIDSLLKKEA